MIEKKNIWLSKANWKSFLIHVWIALLWWSVTVLPQIQDLLTTDLWIEPSIVGAIIIILWVFIKKILNKK